MGTRIKKFFATVLQISADTIDEETTPKDIEVWDSLQHMILISAFEEEFNICIEPEEIVEMYKNYQSFKKIIVEKMK